MRRILPVLTFLCLFGAAFSQAQRLVIVSWDGAADWYVDKLLAEGKLPTIKRMKEQGVYADSVMPCNPSITAAGHASMWTGAWPNTHQISGNSVPMLPRAEHAISESTRGFDGRLLANEPIWMSAAMSGKEVCILSATHSYPTDNWVQKIKANEGVNGVSLKKYTTFSGFEASLYSAALYTQSTAALRDASRFGRSGKEFDIKLGDDSFVAFFAKNAEGIYGDCTLYRTTGEKPDFAGYMKADSSPFSQLVDVRKGEDWGVMTFALLDIAPDLSTFMLYQGNSSCVKGQFDKLKGEDYVRTAAGFDDLPINLYESGKFGPTAWQGGDGKAEAQLLRIIDRDFQRLSDGFEWATRQTNANLIMHYTPAIDSLGHLLMGVLDPDSPRYDKELAAKLAPLYEQAYVLADRWLDSMIKAAGINAIVALVSDHGMEGDGRQVSINQILANAGLATITDGRLDAGKSKVLSPSWNYFLANVNGTDWKNGIVAESDRTATIDAAIKALTEFKDPTTGKPVIIKAMRASEVAGGGGSAGGDLYLEFAPGYHPTSRLIPQCVADDEGKIGTGNHGFNPERLKMRSIFYAIGPGLSAGRNLGVIRQIDIAPSLAILAAIPTPADSIGTNLKLTQKGN